MSAFAPLYRARVYRPGENKKILMKLERMLPGAGKYSLLTKPDGTHYEEFVDRDNAEAVLAALNRGFDGTLGGYVPPAPIVPQYRLRKTLELPTARYSPGVGKTEAEWMKIIPSLQSGDCEVKTDWFEISFT